MAFSTIIGLDGTLGLLRRSLRSGRVAHAYLFEGIEGCGKKKAALAFIEALFCGKEDGCGTCPSCRKIAALQHPDLHLVEPDGSFIKIEQIRELQKQLSFRPFEAPKKACIIDGAERLNAAAGNALLKTLEEPPGNALLILISASASELLPTIVSRCQQLHFPALPHAAIEQHLLQEGIPAETAKIAASLAGGSIGKALEVTREESVQRRASLLERLATLSLGNIAPLFAAAEEQAADKESAREMLELLILFYRDALLYASGGEDLANRDLLPLIERTARSTPRPRLLEKLQQIEEARQALSRNINTRLALDVLFMRLARS